MLSRLSQLKAAAAQQLQPELPQACPRACPGSPVAHSSRQLVTLARIGAAGKPAALMLPSARLPPAMLRPANQTHTSSGSSGQAGAFFSGAEAHAGQCKGSPSRSPAANHSLRLGCPCRPNLPQLHPACPSGSGDGLHPTVERACSAASASTVSSQLARVTPQPAVSPPPVGKPAEESNSPGQRGIRPTDHRIDNGGQASPGPGHGSIAGVTPQHFQLPLLPPRQRPQPRRPFGIAGGAQIQQPHFSSIEAARQQPGTRNSLACEAPTPT